MTSRAAALCLAAMFLAVLPATVSSAPPASSPPDPATDPPATFRPLPDLPGGPVLSAAFGISADGRVVVGQSAAAGGREACYWTGAEGVVSLAPPSGGIFGDFVDAASDDGSVLVGSQQRGPGQFAAYRWSAAEGVVLLGDLPGGLLNSLATDTSSDGSVVVGQSLGGTGFEAYRWTAANGMVPLGDLAGGAFGSNALGISGDGTIVIGHGNSTGGGEAWRWTAATGMVGLGDFPGGGHESSAEGISRNGQWIVGFSRTAEGRTAYRWTAATGMEPLGELWGGSYQSWGEAVSDDGTVVVGHSETDAGHTACIWTPDFGMVPLAPFLRLFGATGLDGWNLYDVTGLTPDGRTLAGLAVDPEGNESAWTATLPPSLDCPPESCVRCVDGDGDGFGDPGHPANLCPLDDCPLVPDPDQRDTDRDRLGDACDPCPLDPLNDADADGICGGGDNCPATANPDQADADGDGRGDLCDNCAQVANAAQQDHDFDGIGDACDLCAGIADPDQADADGDALGDLCDNCPGAGNPDQADANHDGAGDACQPAVRIDALLPSGDTLVARASAADPQGEPIEGRMDLYAEASQPLAFDDPAGNFACDAGWLPGGVVGEGVGYAFASIGGPALFDLDGNFGCIDGSPDYRLALGRCAAPLTGFVTVLDLAAALPGDVVCIRPAGAAAGGSDLQIDTIEPERLTGRLTLESRLVLSTPFAPGLPRRTDIAALEPGAGHRMVLTVTDGKTPAVGAEATFVPQGEDLLLINQPPRAAATWPEAVECDRPGAGAILLDGSGSTDPDDAAGGAPDIVRYEWILDPGGPAESLLAEGKVADAVLPLGAASIALRVTDSAGESDVAPGATAVLDTTAPDLRVVAEPAMLWPPNHKRVRVRLRLAASDLCDPDPVVALASATSSEPDDAPGPADGATTGDIAGADPGTADEEIFLRAERDEGGAGRTYRIVFDARDASGNEAAASGTVQVPIGRALLDGRRLGIRTEPVGVGVSAVPPY